MTFDRDNILQGVLMNLIWNKENLLSPLLTRTRSFCFIGRASTGKNRTGSVNGRRLPSLHSASIYHVFIYLCPSPA